MAYKWASKRDPMVNGTLGKSTLPQGMTRLLHVGSLLLESVRPAPRPRGTWATTCYRITNSYRMHFPSTKNGLPSGRYVDTPRTAAWIPGYWGEDRDRCPRLLQRQRGTPLEFLVGGPEAIEPGPRRTKGHHDDQKEGGWVESAGSPKSLPLSGLASETGRNEQPYEDAARELDSGRWLFWWDETLAVSTESKFITSQHHQTRDSKSPRAVATRVSHRSQKKQAHVYFDDDDIPGSLNLYLWLFCKPPSLIPVPGLRDTARPDPVPVTVDVTTKNVPSIRDTTQPDPGPVPSVRDSAHPDLVPVPSVRDTTFCSCG
ncbi:hypothetical protein P4O66_003367 [Electrophorus voltai]|uniref:Uncharacterized protein n=1 Tax=Electrophorus voltai TaxID=2609070 RepID=A0AAD8YNZ6_9TELE|nr:hypothetical protein P4O66_003367 [Electrophorus voltai]